MSWQKVETFDGAEIWRKPVPEGFAEIPHWPGGSCDWWVRRNLRPKSRLVRTGEADSLAAAMEAFEP